MFRRTDMLKKCIETYTANQLEEDAKTSIGNRKHA